MTVAALVGWLTAALFGVLALRAHRRLERLADAEHELRGAITAFGLGVARFARTAAGSRLAAALESELLRARSALANLAGTRAADPDPARLERLVRAAARAWSPAARGGRIEVDWPDGLPAVAADPGSVAQVLGNLVSNAVEHGHAPVAIRGVAADGAVRVEVANALGDRPRRRGGRGLRIAERAARAAGGRMGVEADPHGVTATLELPLAPGEPR